MREKTDKTLSEILGDFGMPSDPRGRDHEKPLTVWLSHEDKSRYDRIQRASRKGFSEKVRAAVLALMDAAEARIA